MPAYRNPDGTTTIVDPDGRTRIVERPRRGGSVLGGILLIALVIVVALFATGFWSLDVTGGSLPKLSVNATPGTAPAVQLHSKSIVVGTTKQTVDVPSVEVTDSAKQ